MGHQGALGQQHEWLRHLPEVQGCLGELWAAGQTGMTGTAAPIPAPCPSPRSQAHAPGPVRADRFQQRFTTSAILACLDHMCKETEHSVKVRIMPFSGTIQSE